MRQINVLALNFDAFPSKSQRACIEFGKSEIPNH